MRRIQEIPMMEQMENAIALSLISFTPCVFIVSKYHQKTRHTKPMPLRIFLPITLIVFLSLGISNHSFSQGWYNSSWGYRKAITVNSGQVPSTQTNFPVLVNLASDAGLAAHALSTGYDILFTSGDGISKIPYERELFTKSTGALVAWVNVPSVSAGTVIYLYYGNPGATDQQAAASVWDANYKGVWHMKEATGSNLADASSTGWTETQVASPVQTPGQIGGSLNFNGTTQYATHVNGASPFRYSGAITYSFWANMPSGGGGNVMGVDCSGGQGYGGVSLYLTSLGFTWTPTTPGTDDGINSSALSLTAGQWAHIVVTIDFSGQTKHFYVNGSEVSTSFSPSTPSNWNPSTSYSGTLNDEIGSRTINATRGYFKGTLDEVRVSNIIRSADWVKTEFNNQSSPTTFYLVGSEQPAFYVWNHSVSTDWQIAGNWTPARTTPLTSDVLQFNGGGSLTVTNVLTQTISQLLLSGSTTVNLQPSSSSNILTINNALTTTAGDVLNLGSGVILAGTLTTLTNNGKIQTAVPTSTSTTPIPAGKTWGGSIEYNGTSAQTAVGGTYTSLIVNAAGATTVTNSAQAFTVSNNLTVSQGNLVLQATDNDYSFKDVIVSVSGTLTHSVPWDNVPNRKIGISGNLDVTGIFNPTVRSHVNMNTAGAKTIRTGDNPASTLSILTFNDGAFSANGTLKTTQEVWAMFGSTGSFSTAGNNVTFSSMNNYQGTVNVNGGSLTVNVACEVGYAGTTGAINVSSGTLTLNGSLTIDATGSITCTNSPLINISGNWTNNGTYTKATETITFSGGAAQSIGGSTSTTFNNVVINKASGTATLLANQSVAGNLSVTAGTLDLSTFTMNRSAAGGTLTVSNGASLRIGSTNTLPSNYSSHSIGNTSTIEYSGIAQNISSLNSSQTYGNLLLSGSGTKTFGAARTITSNLSINSGVVANLGTFISSAGSLTLGGTGAASGSWGSTGSSATNKNDIYFSATTGIINVSVSCAPPSSTGKSICTGSTATLIASGAVIGGVYKWYDAATGGTLLKTSTDNNDNTFTSPVLVNTTNYWVSIINSTNCESGRIQVTATVHPLPAYSAYINRNISCNGGSEGQINVVISSSQEPSYFFSKNNGTDGYTQSFSGSFPNYTLTGLSAGTYQIIVRDNIGCTSPTIPTIP